MKTDKLVSEVRNLTYLPALAFILAGTVIMALIVALGPISQQTTSFNLDSTVDLEYMNDNDIGNAIIRSGGSVSLIQEPELQACIYAGENSTPVILPVETTNVGISTNPLETINLTISIPEEKLDRDYPQGEVNLTGADRCPLRSQPAVVITEQN